MEIDQTKLNDWFANKWRHGACPVCETDLWAPLPRLGMVPNINPPGPDGGNVVPMLLIYCTNCGYTLPINALVAGVVQEADWEAELSKYSPAGAEQVAEASR
jgi:hypothetical protein